MMATKFTGIKSYLSSFNRQVSIAPLVSFRVIFGLLMCFSLVRFWWRGWIRELYILPPFHFTYQGFEWVQPLGATGMYILFALLVMATLCITTGFLYRAATIFFFLGFTYVELIDVTTYLNHYYFISLVAFIMIWLPANRYRSLDVYFRTTQPKTTVPLCAIGILRFQLAIVYIFAGLAKLNYDWLIQAEPMRTWLPAKSHIPLVGKYMYQEWVAYLFSWFGAVYDLFIVAFLLQKRTRPYAYVVVLIFHIATAVFFPAIGMFPYVMIASSIIFFSSGFHEKVARCLSFSKATSKAIATSAYSFRFSKAIQLIAIVYIFLQLVIPFRYLAYPGHLFWTEEGYRFSWRVMLMEKAGNAIFNIKDAGRQFEVNNAQYLTPLQEKMMGTQPDLILKYAHYLAGEFRKKGFNNPKVYATVYVTLNGAPSRLFTDSAVNLAQQPLSWRHYPWVLPYQR